jgi:hypothetical protein
MTQPAPGAVDRLLAAYRRAIEDALARGQEGEVRAVALIRDGELRDGHVEPAREYPLRDVPASR